jgi:hypothetical protein
MAIRLPSTWQGYFAQPAAPAFTAAQQQPIPPAQRPVRRLYGGYTAGSPVFPEAGTASGGTAPPARPRPPVDHRPFPSEPPRRGLELAWLTWQMPEYMREPAAENLRQTLEWRAQYCKPLKQPKTPLPLTRFGLKGEQLPPKDTEDIRETLKNEARESVRVVEEMQPHLERNHLLAMRGARLGQLCVDLEQRGLDALEILRCELTWLWVASDAGD